VFEAEQEDVVFEPHAGIGGILKDPRRMHYQNCHSHLHTYNIDDVGGASEEEWEVCRKRVTSQTPHTSLREN